MAKTKKTAQELREQAKKLLEQAEKIENERATKIGKLILAFDEDGWEHFNLEDFKKMLSAL